jgi:hypothetical protein
MKIPGFFSFEVLTIKPPSKPPTLIIFSYEIAIEWSWPALAESKLVFLRRLPATDNLFLAGLIYRYRSFLWFGVSAKFRLAVQTAKHEPM